MGGKNSGIDTVVVFDAHEQQQNICRFGRFFFHFIAVSLFNLTMMKLEMVQWDGKDNFNNNG